MNPHLPRRPRQRGFSLVELAVVIIIVGVLASFGVPRYRESVERTKAAEAFNYLASIRTAQERYLGRVGSYTSATADLDIVQDPPAYFNLAGPPTNNIDIVTHDGDPGWEMVLTRESTTTSYGPYKVVFSERGYIPPGAPWANTTSDVPPEILPGTL